MENISIERLEKLGLKTASNRIKELKELKRKITIAYEHFRVVRQEKADTLKEDKRACYLKILEFIPLGRYREVPPLEVLEKIEQAQALNCFDTFEVVKIHSTTQLKDPIVFGRINGCPDRFFVAQWLDDVKIEDILKENEG